MFLADDVLIEDVVDLGWNGQAVDVPALPLFGPLLADDVIAKINAFIADEDPKAPQ